MKNYKVLPLIFFSFLLLILILPRAWLVEVRNFFVFYSIDQIETIEVKETKKDFFKTIFENETSIDSFTDLFNYRKGRLRNKGFSDEMLFSLRVQDCFGDNNIGLMCGCSDISEIITAFCITKNNECIEVVNSSTHSIVYNRTNNTVIDLFYGYVFFGNINELLAAAKNQSLLSNKKFLTLGHYLPKHLQLDNINKNELNIKDITYKKLTEEEVVSIEKTFSEELDSWNNLVLSSLGRDFNKLKIRRGQYYWDGTETIFPWVKKIQNINDNLFRTIKELIGYVLI